MKKNLLAIMEDAGFHKYSRQEAESIKQDSAEPDFIIHHNYIKAVHDYWRRLKRAETEDNIKVLQEKLRLIDRGWWEAAEKEAVEKFSNKEAGQKFLQKKFAIADTASFIKAIEKNQWLVPQKFLAFIIIHHQSFAWYCLDGQLNYDWLYDRFVDLFCRNKTVITSARNNDDEF